MSRSRLAILLVVGLLGLSRLLSGATGSTQELPEGVPNSPTDVPNVPSELPDPPTPEEIDVPEPEEVSQPPQVSDFLPPEEAGVPEPDWSNPFGDYGVPVLDPTNADLAFSPNVPGEALGQPTGVFATNPTLEPAAFREIIWVYNHPGYRFWISERVIGLQAFSIQFAELAALEPGCVEVAVNQGIPGTLGSLTPWAGEASKIVCGLADGSSALIRGGTSALVIAGDVTTSVSWIEPLTGGNEEALAGFEEFNNPQLLITVLGPADELTREGAIAVSNQV